MIHSFSLVVKILINLNYKLPKNILFLRLKYLLSSETTKFNYYTEFIMHKIIYKTLIREFCSIWSFINRTSFCKSNCFFFYILPHHIYSLLFYAPIQFSFIFHSILILWNLDLVLSECRNIGLSALSSDWSRILILTSILNGKCLCIEQGMIVQNLIVIRMMLV